MKLFKGSKQLLPFVFVLFSSLNVHAQAVKHGSELGFALGASNYSGDLVERYRFKFYGPSAQLFYKYNVPGDVSVFRVNLLYAELKGDESAIDQNLQQFRQNSFEASVFEPSLLYEYNFYNFRDLNGQYFMAPYLFGGIGAAIVLGEDGAGYFCLPFGTGIKVMVSRHINVGLEFGARLTFNDKLDGIEDAVQYSSSSNNDWYYFTGLTLSYTWYRQICPF